MAQLETSPAVRPPRTFSQAAARILRTALWQVYRAIGYLGLVATFAALLLGFPSGPGPISNYGFDLGLYAGFILLHLVMTQPRFKELAWGSRGGTATERRVYILVSTASWGALYFLAAPLPGGALHLGDYERVVAALGVLFFLVGLALMFAGTTAALVDGMIALRGAAAQFSQFAAAPLLSAGQYARVRHPKYRAAVVMCWSTLLIHPTMAQLFWVALISGSFIGFIPLEERQLMAARGAEYADYRRRTPYRLFRGIW
ncbi:MAG TPA: hypothetical protein VFE24_03335 [Pirellulales bacterium]|jgi:protein-S-isoprenylcysteine O-methyltransferase Ste14|nr:hypothetical protein [Pirellulales bacterium]